MATEIGIAYKVLSNIRLRKALHELDWAVGEAWNDEQLTRMERSLLMRAAWRVINELRSYG